MKCRICSNSSGKEFEINEMMLGFRDKFKYFQCANCKCLQFSKFPKNLGKYYPKAYYSFQPIEEDSFKFIIRRKFGVLRDKYAMLNKGFFGRIIYFFYPYPVLRLLSHLELNKKTKILDVGSGAGSIIYRLKDLGFDNVHGIDPYLENDKVYKNNLRLSKKKLNEINKKWDIIMFNHSFEHISNPLYTLKKARRLLEDKGLCIIRMPVIPSYAWEKYRTNWVMIDAPRHFFIHSIKSMKILCEKSGFKIRKIIYDSTELQFRGSELYKRNISLFSDKFVFSRKTIKKFKDKAEELNKQKKGDTAVYYLVPDKNGE